MHMAHRYQRVASQPADVGDGVVGFRANKCIGPPASDVLNQSNPTCDIRHYMGGQWSCHHMWSLLDEDQPIPWADQPLVFHHKYRWWVQPYVPSYHTALTLGESVGSALLLGGACSRFGLPPPGPPFTPHRSHPTLHTPPLTPHP